MYRCTSSLDVRCLPKHHWCQVYDNRSPSASHTYRPYSRAILNNYCHVIRLTTDCFTKLARGTDGFQIIIACLKPSKVKNYVRSLCNESLCVSIEAVRYAMACFPSGGR